MLPARTLPRELAHCSFSIALLPCFLTSLLTTEFSRLLNRFQRLDSYRPLPPPHPTITHSPTSTNFSFSHFTSSLLSPGPPAQCPQMLGKTSSFPIPGRMREISMAESSGLFEVRGGAFGWERGKKERWRREREMRKNDTYGKYKSVCPGRTRVWAWMACRAAAKSPL